jgi:hypothetical protein
VSRNAPFPNHENRRKKSYLSRTETLIVNPRFRRAGWLCAVILSLVSYCHSSSFAEENVSTTPERRAQVVIIQDPAATYAFRADPSVVRGMIDRGVTNLLHKAQVSEAWRSLISTQDVVGIKVFSLPGPNSGTRPAVVEGVIQSLLEAKLPPKHIVIWDRQLTDLRLAGFGELAQRYGVRLAGSLQAGYDEHAFYETALLGNLGYGDLEFSKKGPGVGRKSYLTKLVTQDINKIINITPLLNHNSAGVSGNLYSLAIGSVDNVLRFESDPDRLATAVPEIYGLTNLSDHVVMNITDALICQYQGGEKALLHYSTKLDQLRFSQDPVALDVLSIKELEKQRRSADSQLVKPNIELYQNAALLELGIGDTNRIDVEIHK